MVFNDEIKSHILSKLCSYSEEGMIILDEQLNYLWVNHSFEIAVGYPARYLLGKPVSFYPIKDIIQKTDTLTHRLLQSLEETGYFQEDINRINRHGIAIQANLTLWKVSYQQNTYFAGLLRKIELSKTPQHTLRQLSHYNQFTGLPNESVFLSQLSDYLLDTHQHLVIVRFSIDHFDSIYNALPDEDITNLLQQLTQRIQQLNFSHLKIFAHFKMSDFAMFFEVEDATNISISSELEQIINLCELPFTLNTDRFYLRLSMGVSHHSAHGEQVDILLRAAEHALAYQQHHGGDGICWYTDKLNPKVLEGMKFKAQLRDAIAQHQFVPYYQPKFDLQTGRLKEFEALVRWQHPEQGLLEPQYFLQTIIESQLSYELFCHMLRSVIKQLKHWYKLDEHISICINADASEFCSPKFVPFITQLLVENPECQHRLNIEVTEASLMNKNEQTIDTFAKLQALGVSLALDDFGTGYASLSYLSYYPFDYLKIDKSFVENIENNTTQLNIVKAILSLASSLNMRVTAEGIEHQQQVDILKQLGCQYGQGFYFGHPMDAHGATKFIQNQLKTSHLNTKDL